jgi:uncharacterized membrane protein YsdA (DUF1294 family)
MTVILMILLAAVNVFTFILYAYDKFMALRDRWRIPEYVLLISAACMGAIGALAAMRFFRHKTRKPLFYICVPLMMLVQLYLFISWRFF